MQLFQLQTDANKAERRAFGKIIRQGIKTMLLLWTSFFQYRGKFLP